MGLGRIIALLRAPEFDEEVKHLEEERARMEEALKRKAQAAEDELDKLIANTCDARDAAAKKIDELGKTISSFQHSKAVRKPFIRGELPSEPDPEMA